MTQLSIEITEGKELAKKYQGEVIKYSVEPPFRDLVLKTEGESKKSTVVDTGRLRASISHRFEGHDLATIGTNVQYAPFIEFGHMSRGHNLIPARHMEGGSKVLGMGMFEYTIQGPMAEFLKDFEVNVVSNVEKRLSD